MRAQFKQLIFLSIMLRHVIMLTKNFSLNMIKFYCISYSTANVVCSSPVPRLHQWRRARKHTSQLIKRFHAISRAICRTHSTLHANIDNYINYELRRQPAPLTVHSAGHKNQTEI